MVTAKIYSKWLLYHFLQWYIPKVVIIKFVAHTIFYTNDHMTFPLHLTVFKKMAYKFVPFIKIVLLSIARWRYSRPTSKVLF